MFCTPVLNNYEFIILLLKLEFSKKFDPKVEFMGAYYGGIKTSIW